MYPLRQRPLYQREGNLTLQATFLRSQTGEIQVRKAVINGEWLVAGEIHAGPQRAAPASETGASRRHDL